MLPLLHLLHAWMCLEARKVLCSGHVSFTLLYEYPFIAKISSGEVDFRS